MKKETIYKVVFLLLILYINFIWPYRVQDIEQIIGRDISIKEGNTMTLIYRTSFNKDGGQRADGEDTDKINAMVSNIKQYKFKLTSNKDEDVESYTVIISSNAEMASSYKTAGDILRLYTIGNKYIRIENKSGRYKTYEIVKDTLDDAYFRELYNSLRDRK